MTRTRLVVVILFLGGAAITAFLGFTDGALTELRVAWPPPLVVGLIALLTAKRAPVKTPFGVGDWKGVDPAALHALGTAHAFTPQHLEENRAGRLHPDQLAEGLAAGRSDVRFGGVMLAIGQLAVLLGLGTQFFPRALKDVDFTFAWPTEIGFALFIGILMGGFVGALPLVLGVAAFAHGRRTVAAFRRGRVEQVEGPLEKLVVTRRRSGDSYFYVVKGVRLAAPQAAWQAMQGGVYRLYYVPGFWRALSIEPV